MILSRQADYGIRVMLEVATRADNGNITTGSIAERYGIPMPFLQKTVTRLTNAGLLISRRGSGGGLVLAMNANKITSMKAASTLMAPRRSERAALTLRRWQLRDIRLMDQTPIG